MIGVGALICMFAFGQGMQRNIKDQFNQLGLFNYIMVGLDEDLDPNDPGFTESITELNDECLATLMQIPGVEAVYPEMKFPRSD